METMDKRKQHLPKVGDTVQTPRGNIGNVTLLSVDGKDATVLICDSGNSRSVTLSREDLRVVVKK